MKKISKILNIILTLGLCFILTGCVKLENNIKVFKDGEYTSSLKLLVTEELYKSLELDKDEYKNFFIEQLHIQDSENIINIEEEIDDQQYLGFEYNRKRTEPNEEAHITITKDEVNKTITFTIDNHLHDDLWFFSDAFINGKQSRTLEDFNIILEMTIDMPGEVISSNFGEVEEDIVKIDLLKNGGETIIVTSKIDSIVPNLTVISLSLVIIFALTLKFMKNKFK